MKPLPNLQSDPPRNEFEVVAMYNYSKLLRRTAKDLPLTKGEVFTVLDNSDNEWWLAKNQLG